MLAGSALAPQVSPSSSPGKPFTAKRAGQLLSLAAAFALLAISRAGSAQTAAPPLQVLANHVPQVVRQGSVQFLRQLPDDQKIDLTIILPLRNQDQLTQLLGRLYDPQSPDYRKFLSVEDFTAQFGPVTDDFNEVVNFANANGFTVTGQPRNRMLLSIKGTAAQVNSAFHVRMGEYQHPTENRTFYAPDREPTVALHAQIAHIDGMNNLNLPHPAQAGTNAYTESVNGSGPGGSYLGIDFRAAYYGKGPLTGLNQTAALVELYEQLYSKPDIDLYFSSVGQTYSTRLESIPVGGAIDDVYVLGASAEADLDVQQLIGMAPDLSALEVYIGTSSAGAEAAVLNQIAADNTAKQIGCSEVWIPESIAAQDAILQEMAAQGQTFFVASGDSGAYASLDPLPATYPTESQYVTAVGGTHLITTGPGGAWSNEASWFGSGGGPSPDLIGIPSWQQGLANSSNGASNTLRNVPDVAMDADADSYVCYLGVCFEGGSGTSFSAPRWAGFMALVNQQAVENGNAPTGGIGFINAALTRIGTGPNYNKDFHDIQSGLPGDVTLYNAVPGYDLMTGWGTPAGQPLIDDLAGPMVPGFWIAPANGAVNLTQGSSATDAIAVTDAGGFSGMVNLAVISRLPAGVTASFTPASTSSTSVLTFTASNAAAEGSFPVTITGTAGAMTQTTNLLLTVANPLFTLSTDQAAYTVNQGGSSTGNLLLNGSSGFSGAVSLTVDGLPAGVTVNFASNPAAGGSASDAMTFAASNSTLSGTYTVTITGTSGSYSASTALALTVAGQSFALAPAPAVIDLFAGGAAQSTVAVNPINGFSGTVSFSISGLPAGVTAAWNPASSTSAGVVTLTASGSAPLGKATATITGISGSLSAAVQLPVVVRSPVVSSTATILAITSGGSTVNTAAWGSLVTLTASVTSGGTKITSGLVNFCDSDAPWCGDIHLLGSAQLTSAGTASMVLRPLPGNHSYKAEFTGTVNDKASSSSVASLDVTGDYPTTTTLASSGSVGNYTLNATVNGTGAEAPTGSILFANASSGNSTVGSASLVAGAPALNWAQLSVAPLNQSLITGIVAGDFNGDGVSDVAILNQHDQYPSSILLGNPDGTFTVSSSTVQPSLDPVSATTGDFNGDGHLDIAVLTQQPNNETLGTVNIFLGNGDGTFNEVPTSTNLGILEYGFIVNGDFNGDGIADLAVSSSEPGDTTIAILLGNGDGTFTEASNPQTGAIPSSMAVADFNADGLPDIAVTNSGDDTVSILLGNGDGTFTTLPNPIPVGNLPFAIAVADFNGDGVPDIAIGNYYDNTVSILLGQGDGTFSAEPNPIPVGNNPLSIAIGDFNHDGTADMAVENYTDSTLSVLLGNGDGTFKPASPAALPNAQYSYPEEIATGTATSSGFPVIFAPMNYVTQGDLLICEVATLEPYLAQSATASATAISVGATGSNLVAASYAGDPNYSGSQSNTVTLNGSKYVALSWATPAAIAYGTPLGAGQLNATAGVAGSFSYSPAVGTVLPLGTQTLSVTFAPADTIDYAATTATVQIAVTQATPTITWPTPAAIVYKTPLGAAQYNATASVPGTFVYAPVAGTVLSAGTQTLSVTFTPNDTTDYTSITQTVQLTVNPAALTVTANNASMTYGSAVPTLGGAVAGLLFGDGITASYATTATSASTVGAYPITATLYDPNHKLGNYLLTNTPGTLTIGQAVPAITWAPASITYGTALGAAQLDASTPVAGSFSYSPAAGTLLGAGSQTLVAAFTPTDNIDYSKTAESAALIVGKAPPQVGLISSASPVLTQNPVTLTATVSSSVSTPTGSVTFLNGSTVLGSAVALNSSGVAALTTTALPIGSNSISAVYSGDANFVTGISGAVAETIEDFSLAVSPGSGSITSATVMPGQTATFNLVISPAAPATTFPAAIILTVSGLPPGATYTITPQSLAAGSGSTAVTLTVTTSATAANRGAPLITPLSRRMAPLALALLLLPLARRMRRAGGRVGRVLILLAVLAAGAAAIYGIGGCGGTSGQAQQTYSISVTGTSGSLSHSTSVSLTVE